VTSVVVLFHCRVLTVLHFFASWAPQCQQVDDVLLELQKDPGLAAAVKLVKVFLQLCNCTET